ncbi:MAG: hypothetical protein AAF766_18385 [Cyanobacteria bacterium P01_D01_bin.14]
MNGLRLSLSAAAAVAIGVTTGIFDAPQPAFAQNHSGCYIENDGQLYDLAALCGSSSFGAEPVLQTGDIQVTLRWQTEDDLDLIVVDPSGDTVSYFNPSVPSGGQLDVDANAYCESPGFSPVENIFWPTGGAPGGEYSATVVLSIPCAERTTTVDYRLTILNQGDSQTYQGTVGTGAINSPYVFTLQ